MSLADDLITDIAVFTNMAEFGAIATIPSGSVPVIYDRPHEGALAGLVEATQPSMLGATSDLGALHHGDAVAILQGGVTSNLYVVSTEPDGTGMTRVILEAA